MLKPRTSWLVLGCGSAGYYSEPVTRPAALLSLHTPHSSVMGTRGNMAQWLTGPWEMWGGFQKCNLQTHFTDWYPEHFQWNFLQVNATGRTPLMISYKLAPRIFELNFRRVIFETDFNDWWLRHLLWNCPNMNVTGLHWWSSQHWFR